MSQVSCKVMMFLFETEKRENARFIFVSSSSLPFSFLFRDTVSTGYKSASFFSSLTRGVFLYFSLPLIVPIFLFFTLRGLFRVPGVFSRTTVDVVSVRHGIHVNAPTLSYGPFHAPPQTPCVLNHLGVRSVP